MEHWNDADFARQWAAQNTEENPARKPALDLLLKVLTEHLASAPVPQRVLDLGCGHGIIAARVLQEIEGTTLMGDDGSSPMLDLAREQLAPYPGRWSLHQAGFEAMSPADLAGEPFGAAIAVQSLTTAPMQTSRRRLPACRPYWRQMASSSCWIAFAWPLLGCLGSIAVYGTALARRPMTSTWKGRRLRSMSEPGSSVETSRGAWT